MVIPRKHRVIRWLSIFIFIYGIAWIALEGNAVRVRILGLGLSTLLVVNLLLRLVGGKYMSPLVALIAFAGSGLALGLTGGVFTLALMAVKMGLHAHGPEFSPDEINRLVALIPFWGTSGALAGLGLALITMGSKGPDS